MERLVGQLHEALVGGNFRQAGGQAFSVVWWWWWIVRRAEGRRGW
jgi:hypothetical protein